MSVVRVPSLQEIAFANIFQRDMEQFYEKEVQALDHLMSHVFRKTDWTVCCLIEDHRKPESLSSTNSWIDGTQLSLQEPRNILGCVYKPFRLWDDFKNGNIIIVRVFNILTPTSTKRALEMKFFSISEYLYMPTLKIRTIPSSSRSRTNEYIRQWCNSQRYMYMYDEIFENSDTDYGAEENSYD